MVTGGTGGLEGADRGRSRPRRSPASRSRASARPCGRGLKFSSPVAVGFGRGMWGSFDVGCWGFVVSGCWGFVWILKKERELRCGYDLRAYVPETERSEKKKKKTELVVTASKRERVWLDRLGRASDSQPRGEVIVGFHNGLFLLLGDIGGGGCFGGSFSGGGGSGGGTNLVR